MLRRTLVAVALVLMLMVSAVSAQEPGGAPPGGPGGPGGPGFGPGGMPGAGLMLLWMPAVQSELAITDEQKTKVTELQQTMMEQMRTSMPDFRRMQDMSQEERTKFLNDIRKKAEKSGKQVEEKLGKILDAKQLERLKQIQLQMQGATALTNPDVVAKLKLSDDAQGKIKKIIDDSRKQFPRIDFFNATDEERKAAVDKMQKQRKATMKAALAVLDDDQLVEWGTMIGKEFQFPQGPGFGFGGPPPGGRGPGGDRQPPPGNE